MLRLCALTVLAAATAVRADHPGESLAPELLGPGVVESWQTILERDANRPASWDANPKDRENARGQWIVPSRGATVNARSGVHYATNKWGDTSMGIGFGGLVDVDGAWIAGQADEGVWPPALRVIGYRDGVEVGRTAWFHDIDATPDRLAIDLRDVDRIVFEAQPAWRGAAWFAVDDLAFVRDGVPALIDFEDCGYREKLTGSAYRGLAWEEGTGAFEAEDEGVHAPVVPERAEPPAEPGLPEPYGPPGFATLPDLMSDFESVRRGDAGSWSYPADTCGAIGPDQFVTVVNRVFSVQDKTTGAVLSEVSLGSFMPGASGDPRIVFDHLAQRWFVIASNFSNRIYLAASTSSNALGSWYKTSFVTSTGADNGHWPDYPTLGVNAHGLYTSAYMVGSPTQMTIFALDKAPLIAPSPSLGAVTAFRELPWEGAIQPVIAYETTDVQHFISRSSASVLRVRTLSGSLASPTLSEPDSVLVYSHQSPPNVPALGSTTPLNSVDPRLMNAMELDGQIWAAHTIGLNDRAAVRWYQVDVSSMTAIQIGTVSDEVLNYFFPSICADADGNVALGCSGAHAGIYAGAYYTGRRANDPPGQMASPALLRAGAAPQNNIDNQGRNRWGDYSLTTLDPLDDRRLWTIQKYAHNDDVWGTHVAELFVSSGPGNDYCQSITAAVPGTNFFDTTNAGTEGFPETGGCLNGDGQIANDIWFKFDTPCTGNVTLSFAGSSFDTAVAVYEYCPDGPDLAIACDDDSAGNGQAEVTFFATQFAGLRIRVGSTAGGEGTGVMEITCTPTDPPCAADLDGSGDVGFNDLVALLSTWGPCPDCPADLDGDGDVAFSDLVTLLSVWGPCE